jgi:hypothetical protein
MMIYRLWDTKKKCYATPEEMLRLRVNSGGVVEELKQQRYLRYEPINMVIHLFKNAYAKWQPTPQFEVEHGVITQDRIGNPLNIYHGDKYLDWNTGDENIHQQERILNELCMMELTADFFPMIEIIGNIHEA